MNLICIMADTLRADYLGCYGNPWVKTPHLDQLAKQSVLLENLYVEGLATIPERTVFFTGKYTLPFRRWQPLWDHDVTLTQVLKQQGYLTSFITDTAHYFAPGMNFHRWFDGWQLIRGQEFDRYITDRNKGRNPEEFMKAGWRDTPRERRHLRLEDPTKMLAQYLRNVADRKSERDYFTAQVFQRSIDWLKGNYEQSPFFLWIDSFDPHEPWDPPKRYYEKYAPAGYNGPWLIAPWLISVAPEDFTEEEIAHMKALYAGEVTFLDAWVGRLLNAVWDLGLAEDTIILFTADHGTQFGEHGTISKSPMIRHTVYKELARIPGIFYHPHGKKGCRIGQLMWTPDIMPTLLTLLGIALPENVHGTPQPWIISDEAGEGREYAVSGHYGQKDWRATDGKWSYIASEEPELYHLEADPDEQRNVIAQYPKQAQRLQGAIEAFLEQAKQLHP